MKLVLFDCDGTLVDSAALIHETMRRTFQAFGKPEPRIDATRSIIGLSLDIAIADMLGMDRPDDECRSMMAFYKEQFVSVRQDGFGEELYEGIELMLNELGHRDNVIVGAVTGKSRRGLSSILGRYDFGKLFFVSRTADDCPSKPHPAMVLECCKETGIDVDRTVVIGDTIYDIEMAKAAGAHTIGVSWGYGAVDALVSAGAENIVMTAAEIIEQVERF